MNDEIGRLFGALAVSADPEGVWGQIEETANRIADAAPPELSTEAAAGLAFCENARVAPEAANWDVSTLESMPPDPAMDQIEASITEYLEANCP